MSVRDRLEDARILWAANRREGAFVQILVAVAATARKRYPQSQWDDSESFRNFVYDELGVITGAMKYNVEFSFRGKPTPLEDIIYHHFRCQLLHEGELPQDINLTEPVVVDGKLCSQLNLGTPLGFPVGWIERLASAVWLSPENDSLWPEESEKRRTARVKLGDLIHSSSFCRRPGQQTKETKGKNAKISWTAEGETFTISYPPSTTVQQLSKLIEIKAEDLRDNR